MRIIHCLLLAFALASNLGNQDEGRNNKLTGEPKPKPESATYPADKSTGMARRETFNLSGMLKNIHNPFLGSLLGGVGVGYFINYQKPSSFFLGCACFFFSMLFTVGGTGNRIQDQ